MLLRSEVLLVPDEPCQSRSMHCHNNPGLLTKRDLMLPTRRSHPDGVTLSTQLLYSQTMRQSSPLKPSGTKEEGEEREPALATEPGQGRELQKNLRMLHSSCSSAIHPVLRLARKTHLLGEDLSPRRTKVPQTYTCLSSSSALSPMASCSDYMVGLARGHVWHKPGWALLHVGATGSI